MSRLRHDREHSPSIMGCQERQEKASGSSAEGQRHEEFLHRILHGACGKEKIGAKGAGGGSKAAIAMARRSPLPEDPVNLGECSGRELTFERFFSLLY